jgi:hypothetical protein
VRYREIIFDRKFRAAFAAACLLLGAAAGFECYPYASALLWHHRNGDYTDVGGHKVRLPLLWSRKDISGHQTVELVRAWPMTEFPKPSIRVSPTYPGQTKQTDQDELDHIQGLISYENATLFRKSYLVVLKPRPFVLYCEKSNSYPRDGEIDGNLDCKAARIPFKFDYHGPPQHEKDAESILSSLE